MDQRMGLAALRVAQKVLQTEAGTAHPALYWNNTHTGKYVWKKEALIDCTFPQVLDRMVEEFPDQYAFKYIRIRTKKR